MFFTVEPHCSNNGWLMVPSSLTSSRKWNTSASTNGLGQDSAAVQCCLPGVVEVQLGGRKPAQMHAAAALRTPICNSTTSREASGNSSQASFKPQPLPRHEQRVDALLCFAASIHLFPCMYMYRQAKANDHLSPANVLDMIVTTPAIVGRRFDLHLV